MGSPKKRTMPPGSFEDFYAAEYPRVYRAVFLTVRDRDEALDICQEAFARVFARWAGLSNETWAGGWAMTTAINLCRRHERRKALGKLLTARRREDTDDASPDDRLDLLAALDSLPFRQRQAMLLHYLGDLPIAAVGQLMGVSEGAVKAHLSQARKKLRLEMGVFHAG